MKKVIDGLLDYKLIILAGILELVYVTGYGVIWFILPLLAEEISKDVFLVGVLVSFPTIVSMLLAMPVGGLSDKFGRKKPIILGALVIISIGLSLPQFNSVENVLLFGFFFGLAHQLFNTPIKAYILDIAPLKKTAEYFGVYSAAFSFGLMGGSAAGGFLLANNLAVGVVDISYFYAFVGLLALLVALLLKETVDGKAKHSVKITSIFRGDELIFKHLWEYKKLGAVGLLVLYLTFIIYFCPGVTWTLEPLFYNLGMDSTVVGFILVMFTLPLVLFAIPAGQLADKYGKITTIIPGLLVGGIFLVVFGLTNEPWILLVSAFISTCGFAFVWSSTNGMLADISSGNRKGSVVGVWNIFEDLGYIIGPIFAGLAAGIFGNIKTPFVILGMIILVSILPVILVAPKTKQNK